MDTSSSSSSSSSSPTSDHHLQSQERYPYPSQLNAASFVSIKLSGKANFGRWQGQMRCLIESQEMLGFIDGTCNNPDGELIEKTNEYRKWKRSDMLVKGWILGSLSEDVMDTVLGLHTAHDVWKKLFITYNRPIDSSEKGEQLYPYPSHVNAASFLSIKLSGKNNFARWQEQMMCLLDSHDMLGFIDGKFKNPKEAKSREWKRSDMLVKGWILGSLCEDVVTTVVGIHTANDVWKKLTTAYNPPKVTTSTPKTTTIIGKDPSEYTTLYGASLMGEWEKAQEIFNNDPSAITAEINNYGDRSLHMAVTTGDQSILFVEKLLEVITPETLPTLVSNPKYTSLHSAAMVGNTAAAKMLVNKSPCMLYMADNGDYLPIHRAIFVPHVNTFQYLLKASRDHLALSQQHGYHNPFEGRKGAVLLTNVITAGLFDVALELIKEYPVLARTKNGDINTPLSCISKKLDAFRSGSRYNFFQNLVYSYVPIGENSSSLSNTRKVDVESQNGTRCLSSFRSCFHSVPYINHIKEDKVRHDKAMILLKCICDEVRKLNKQNDIRGHYISSTNMAAINDTHEVIEKILLSFPQAIWCSTKDDLRIIQVAIINRCEKVYNVFVHQMSDNNNLHKVLKDKKENNLMHLAAQLAPIHRLNLVSGAALQMQRELQWFQEVERFALPKHKDAKNSTNETPIMVFRREHKELRKEGEEWMKKTADSYTITAALIITIVFAAAITVPGGNDGDSGQAIFTKKGAFIIFAVSDAISLFTSTTSLLLFLSILTARYADEDFLYSLPKRLIIGLTTLFMSMTSMMVAFSATLYLMFGQGKAWILVPIAALTCLPIASFVTLQFPLLVELFSSTYGRGIFVKHSDRRIY